VDAHVAYQPSLFDGAPVGFDPAFPGLSRIQLDEASWVDHLPAWLRGSDAVFAEVLADRDWGQRTRWMYDQRVKEPRLTAPWSLASGEPLRPTVLEEIRRALCERYGVRFDSVGFNLYRDGADSVAWHADKIDRSIEAPTIALLSLGEPRKFLLRRKGPGRSIPLQLGRGDLLVTGGATNRRWEHCVPKVARAGPRISVAYRHDLDPRAYAGRWEAAARAAHPGSSSG
jgi:alkylated DNA repair dioxygenase AlkB